MVPPRAFLSCDGQEGVGEGILQIGKAETTPERLEEAVVQEGCLAILILKTCTVGFLCIENLLYKGFLCIKNLPYLILKKPGSRV